jgi:hypothetical protein
MSGGRKKSKLKNLGKIALKSAAITGLVTGTELGIMYVVYKLRGSNTPSAKKS